jgi:transglutaminase-like putative cysteine protease
VKAKTCFRIKPMEGTLFMKIKTLTVILVLACIASVHSQSKKRTDVVFKYNIITVEPSKKVIVTALIPQSVCNRQEVISIEYTVQPVRTFVEKGNAYAEFIIENPPAVMEIAVFAKLNLIQNGLQASKRKGDLCQIQSDSLSQYLIREKYIEKDDSLILLAAKELKDEDRVKTLKKTYNFVTTTIKYTGYMSDALGAVKALQTKGGDCTEFADLFLALCRANDIPARVAKGYVTTWGNTPKHDWVEAYVDGYGWVPFETTPGHNSSFQFMENKYVYLSNTRSDKLLNNGHSLYYRWYGGKVRVTDSFQVYNN